MRYIFLVFGVLVVTVMLIAGKRGDLSRNRPFYIFPDMKWQLKLRPQKPGGFFPDGLSSQMPPPGTVARSEPIETLSGLAYEFQDTPAFTGRVPGTTNFVENIPLPVTGTLLVRGQQRYTIYCSPCHGQLADGNGMPKKIGAMAVVANLHDKRIVELADGEIFNTISHGKGVMQAYGPQIPVEDRWAIVAYVRTVQLSHLGTVDDLPQDLRSQLK